jgi:hypothetical protein
MSISLRVRAEGYCIADAESKLKSCPVPVLYDVPNYVDRVEFFYPCSWEARGNEPTKLTLV